MVEGNVSVSPDPSFSPSESDSRSRGTSVDEGVVVGRTKERARSEGVIPDEDAPVSADFRLYSDLSSVLCLSETVKFL